MKRKKSVITGRAEAARTPKRLLPGLAALRPPRSPVARSAETMVRGEASSSGDTATATASRRAAESSVPSGSDVADGPVEVDLGVDLAPDRGEGLWLSNPLMAASGAFGFGVEFVDVVDLDELGAIVTRGVTLKARTGNAPPRIAETAVGLLNAVGLQNPGLEAVLERYADRWAAWSVPVIVNVAAGSVDEFAAIARGLDSQPGVAGLELNLSCPNTARGGTLFALEPAAAGQATAAVRRATDLPLIVKVSAAAGDVRTVGRAVEDAGADAISAINTLPALALDARDRRAAVSTIYGGLSGPALKPIALRVVHELFLEVEIPIVGIGGIASLDDVLDFLAVGATAVQVGTALFADPQRAVRLAAELRDWCVDHGVHRVGALTGVAHTKVRPRPSTKGGEYRP